MEKQVNFAEELAQVAAEESGKLFRDTLRGFCRIIIMESIAEEVKFLCGDKHHPEDETPFRRAGSASGSILVDTNREQVVRPRIRRLNEDGSESEHHLDTYQAAQNSEEIVANIVTAYASGVPSRSVEELFPNAGGTSRSEVSRHWTTKGAEYLGTLRDRELSQEGYLAVFIDGIHLGKDAYAVAALGLRVDGTKEVLDFEPGSSETSEVCRELLSRLESRGMTFAGRPLFIIDGSAALRKGIKAVHPRALIQRCLVHLERNVKGYLPRRHYGKVAELFRKLRTAQGGMEGRAALRALRNFLEKVNRQAFQCVLSAGLDMITIHLLNVPNSLHISLLSTNCIENIFGTARKKIGRVKRWNAATDMGARWVAYALLGAEKGFRKISGHNDLYALQAALEKIK